MVEKYIKLSDIISFIRKYGVGSQDFDNYTPEQAERFLINNLQKMPYLSIDISVFLKSKL